MDSPKVALITGGASGIGLAVAKDLLSKGWKVCIYDVEKPDGFTNWALLSIADVTDYDALARAFASVWSKWGRLDFVFANAGVMDAAPFFKLMNVPKDSTPPPKPNLKALDVNLTAVIHTAYLAAHYFRQNPSPGGKIVATAGVSGIYGMRGMPIEAASKHGVVGLVRSLAPSLEEDNITFNCICPAVVQSGITTHFIELVPHQFITPMSIVVKAVNNFLEGSETGRVAELCIQKIIMRDQVGYPDAVQQGMAAHTVPIIAAVTWTRIAMGKNGC